MRHTVREMLNHFTGSKARLLLAEDSVTIQKIALGVLEKLGLHADAVANGAEAIKALETFPYDLVLMDVMMPVMDGLEATSVIRDPESAVLNHQLPILAMTAHTLQGDREKCLEVGMNDYVSKSLSPQALADALDKWLPKETTATTHPTPGAPQDTDCLAAQNQEAPVFDRAGMMTRLMNDRDLARVVIEAFLEDLPRQIEALRGYLEAQDAPSTERQTHTIKGASAIVAGERLCLVASEMENAAKAGDLNVVKDRMADLQTEFDRLKPAMTSELRKQPPKENAMRILIAEDDFTSRLLLQELLKSYGTAHLAVNGKEAVEAVRASHENGEPYDLICLDIMMPEMDGQEALRQIRDQEQARGILSSDGAKVVMTTALGDMKNVGDAFHSLCDAYLTKPIQKAKLVEALRGLVLIP
jgi:CheY-like chemotaxis protein/HPt (histidine-containing phosphotransfer) domain-containing protein